MGQKVPAVNITSYNYIDLPGVVSQWISCIWVDQWDILICPFVQQSTWLRLSIFKNHLDHTLIIICASGNVKCNNERKQFQKALLYHSKPKQQSSTGTLQLKVMTK